MDDRTDQHYQTLRDSYLNRARDFIGISTWGPYLVILSAIAVTIVMLAVVVSL